MQAEKEGGLDRIEVADAGEVALVEQSLDDRPLGTGAQSSNGFVERPVGAEDVGTEMADDAALLLAADDLHRSESEADRAPLGVAEDEPGLVRGRAPARVGSVDVPAALHLEVRVNGDLGQPRQDVLAAGDGLVDVLAD